MSDVDASKTVPGAPPAAWPAGLLVRLAALLYDSLLLLSVLFLATAAVLPLSHGEAMQHNPFYQTYLLLVSFFYFGWHWVRNGQTLGMRAWRLRVAQVDGSPLTWWHALARFLFAIPSLLLFGLGFFWVLLDKRHQTWHDRIAGTMVVREAKRTRL